jgi:Family of unknown function (DUF6011)
MDGPQNEVGAGIPNHQDNRPTTNNSHHSKPTAPSVTRCRRCKRPLSAPLSLLLGAGPVCRRHILDGAPLFNALNNTSDGLAA